MTTSTRSKRSTASDTATRKTRRLRLGGRAPELNQFFDLYWGGPERRITGLTLRVIGVNAVALLILVFGMLYLSQYQSRLIETRLETFKTEAELVAAALSQPGDQAQTAQRLSRIMSQRIRVFDARGNPLADSGEPSSAGEERAEMISVQTLKNMAGWIIEIMPERRALPAYPAPRDARAESFPDAPAALNGQISLSAWHNDEGRVFLSAAAPIAGPNGRQGAALLTRQGGDIEEAIGAFWIDILKIFGFTLIITILLSIYLSGTIARPLRKLARAAENVRAGTAAPSDIPDLSYRHDEIGELSLVLRDMTQALQERMDSIESFAADVAHELKNPLTSLRSAVETAAIVKKQSDKDKLFGIVMHDLQRLDRLISDISNASRIEAEMSREEFSAFDLTASLARLIDAYKNPLERDNGRGAAKLQSGAIIELHAPRGVYVRGAESRLLQVFDNLLSNAISFSPKNGKVRVDVSPQERRISVTVEDEGPGIPSGKLESVFERFYSERPEHEDYGQHSGLGLSIAKQIVEAHNGVIYAENIRDSDGKIAGARFTVILQPARETGL